MGDLTENFSRWEFSCRCGCGLDTISIEHVRRLQMVRNDYGKPIRINSGVRCEKYNKEVGGVDGSEHVPLDAREGEGSDLECDNSLDRDNLLYRSRQQFDRVGIDGKFIHVGSRTTKPRNVTWLYD